METQAMVCRYFLILLVLLLAVNSEARESPICAATINELRGVVADQSFPMNWVETTMTDQKPLMLSILERNGTLFLEFIKTSEGLWAEGSGVICGNGSGLEIRFAAEQIRVGRAANWLLRGLLANGGKFTMTKLGYRQLRIATSGWSGVFSSSAK